MIYIEFFDGFVSNLEIRVCNGFWNIPRKLFLGEKPYIYENASEKKEINKLLEAQRMLYNSLGRFYE